LGVAGPPPWQKMGWAATPLANIGHPFYFLVFNSFAF
jgi:hypothetical protein